MTSAYRHLPAVETLVQAIEQQLNGNRLPRDILTETARTVIASARTAIHAGHAAPSTADLIEQALAQTQRLVQPSLRPVINASGVIIQTNLGRAPLSQAALEAMVAVGSGYSNLEYDLASGERGSRTTHLNELLCRLTGAEAALAVNNNAAAIYLVLIALAVGREVIVSRGQAVEIGGGFRIPDVLRQSGATLVEVGTTNRTYLRDYAAAINERTALLMRIHTSNFRLMGFVAETTLAELATLGHERGVPVVDDLGSGTLLPTAPYGLAPEPTVGESIAAGADLVTFSGDKLLGGPQAGLIVGRKHLIEQLKQHPLARALRVDKTTIAGLAATLQSYVQQQATSDIPVWMMIAAPIEVLQARAEQLVAQLGSDRAEVMVCESAVGGGSLPGETLPSRAVALTLAQPDAVASRLRQGQPAVVARISQGKLLLDLRTVLVEQEPALLNVLRAIID
jgi:L-seryl-tRNA(Ser) seleniumtransferase